MFLQTKHFVSTFKRTSYKAARIYICVNCDNHKIKNRNYRKHQKWSILPKNMVANSWLSFYKNPVLNNIHIYAIRIETTIFFILTIYRNILMVII